VNIDHAKGIAQREGVRSIPDVRIFRDGKEVHRFVGAVDAAGIRALFQEHGEGLQVATQEAPAASTSPPTAEPSIQPMKKDWRPPGVERR
jgi:thioredoxin-like negative regulator of GroEL